MSNVLTVKSKLSYLVLYYEVLYITHNIKRIIKEVYFQRKTGQMKYRSNRI